MEWFTSQICILFYREARTQQLGRSTHRQPKRFLQKTLFDKEVQSNWGRFLKTLKKWKWRIDKLVIRISDEIEPPMQCAEKMQWNKVTVKKRNKFTKQFPLYLAKGSHMKSNVYFWALPELALLLAPGWMGNSYRFSPSLASIRYICKKWLRHAEFTESSF